VVAARIKAARDQPPDTIATLKRVAGAAAEAALPAPLQSPLFGQNRRWQDFG
jgi:hypothetical protein